MVAEELIYAFPEELASQLIFIIRIIQAIGGLVVIYLAFTIVNMFLLRKRNKEVQKVLQTLEEIKEILRNKK